MNRELKNVVEWLNENKLKLKVNKTKCMLVVNNKTKANDFEVRIDDVKIDKVQSFKYLGVILTKNYRQLKMHNSLAKNLLKRQDFLAEQPST